MENQNVEKCMKKRGRQLGNHSKWSKPRYHIEIKGVGNQSNFVVGDFCNREDAGKALTELLGYRITGGFLRDLETGKSERHAKHILISHIDRK